MKNLEKKIKELEAKKGNLIWQFRQALRENKDSTPILQAIKETENQIHDLRIKSKVDEINKREAERREIAKRVFELSDLPIDLVTAGGHAHKIKIKNYPKLVKLMQDYKISFEVDSYNFVKLRVYSEKNRTSFVFSNYTPDYEKSHHNGRFYERHSKRYKTLKEMMQGNNILLKKLTFQKVEKDIESLIKLTEKIKNKIEKYENDKKRYNPYFLQNEGFIEKRSGQFSEYWEKF